MKFGYRDRIILLVVCVIIIFVIGIFAFIKPKYEDLTKNKQKRETLQNQWEVQLNDFKNINTRQGKIEENFKKATEIADNFTDEMDSVSFDQYLQKTFMNTEDGDIPHIVKKEDSEETERTMKLHTALSVSDQSAGAIAYYYYTPSVITYPLYEYADMDGSLAAATDEKLKESQVLSQRGSESVGMGTANFTLRIKRDQVMDLFDYVHKYAVDKKDTMLIRSVSFSDYKFKGTALDDTAAATKPNTPSTSTGEDEKKEEGYADVNIVYEVYYMQEPKKPDLGPSYDEKVWEGDTWRTYTSSEAAG